MGICILQPTYIFLYIQYVKYKNKFGRINLITYICRMKTLLHLTAQVKENYGTPDKPHWKFKGQQIFSVNVDADAFMYAKDEAINALKTLLTKKSNPMFAYEFVDFELLFNGIDVLNDADFEAEVLKECELTANINTKADEYKAQINYELGHE